MNLGNLVYPELKIGSTAFFLMHNKVVNAVVEEIRTVETKVGISITYTIDKNPAGDNYTKHWSSKEIFSSKQQLLDSL